MLKLPVNPAKYIACSSTEQLIIFAAISLFCLCLPTFAQLPPTNMGKFVHQPGDNQYSYQTQVERHPAAAPAYSAPAGPVAGAPAGGQYRPTPAAAKPDISLLPIVADEPLKPAGFPPLPDRLDLPGAGSPGLWTANLPGQSGAGGLTLQRDVSSSPTGVHEHYVHYNAGAFIPKDQLQQQVYENSNYKPSATDYYNVNPVAKPTARQARPFTGVSSTVSETPSTQALRKMGAEPQLAADAVSKPEVPTAVTVNQSVSQDLSLPEDDFNKHYPANIANSTNSRMGNGIGRTLMYPMRSLLYTGMGMGMGMAASSGVYALHR